ncbi:DUF1194 domain-containing protein [Tropicimonas sp. IMCC34011]|uniref:DUF1194 domain-containing protein n=1 Tax=Tropicimonas sp. IMCC34011 TaxID=2248759 RepID=UPI000E25F5E8|nr:DUF1194 domain-containing protein [Tropicimonas sp. IMCC34011]
MIRTLLSAASLAAFPGAADACRLALLLAIDVSSSVDAREDALQRQGLAAALVSEEVRAGFLATLPDAPVALSVFEWSGRWTQTEIISWTLIDGADALESAAARISASPRSETESPTALGYALGYASGAFADAPPCAAHTLDVSGDGPNNEGFGPGLAYANFDFAGVTVNGLPIVSEPGDPEGLERYYEESVLHGPGAFSVVARGYDDVARAMREKLTRELAGRVYGALR